MNRYVLVRWKDSSRLVGEASDEDVQELKPCVRETVGWLIHDQTDRLTVAMDRVTWPGGEVEWTHVYSILPRNIEEKVYLEGL